MRRRTRNLYQVDNPISKMSNGLFLFLINSFQLGIYHLVSVQPQAIFMFLHVGLAILTVGTMVVLEYFELYCKEDTDNMLSYSEYT